MRLHADAYDSRRASLGYPLYIVEAKEHTIVRWDDPKSGERFNFDGTSHGFIAHDDLYYLNRPVPLTETDRKHHPRYLKNLTREQEIALMIRERAQCMMYNLRPFEALIAYEYADAFDPENFLLESNWAIATVVQKAFDTAMKTGRQEGW